MLEAREIVSLAFDSRSRTVAVELGGGGELKKKRKRKSFEDSKY